MEEVTSLGAFLLAEALLHRAPLRTVDDAIDDLLAMSACARLARLRAENCDEHLPNQQ
jgi:hypothetical protein